MRAAEEAVVPLGLPYRLVLTRVEPEATRRAQRRQDELRARGLDVANTLIRTYVAYNEAAERGATVLDLTGRHHRARKAERDYFALAHEVFALAGLPTHSLPVGSDMEEVTAWAVST